MCHVTYQPTKHWSGCQTSKKPDEPMQSLEEGGVGAESDQQVNICSFAVRCDRRWPSTQWHRVYTGSDNVPYVQFELAGDFIPEPRCSKFTVGLQTEGSKMGGARVRSDYGLKGQEWRELRYVLSVRTSVVHWNPWSFRSLERVSVVVRLISLLGESASPYIDKGDGLTREREYVCY